MTDRGIFQAHYEDAIFQHHQLELKYNRLLSALTPSAETKYAYIGEVKDDVTVSVEDDECDMVEKTHRHVVSWTAMKDMMALIRKEAGIDV